MNKEPFHGASIREVFGDEERLSTNRIVTVQGNTATPGSSRRWHRISLWCFRRYFGIFRNFRIVHDMENNTVRWLEQDCASQERCFI